jgi:anaerobic magnesium-protoporphyrin IX monomethyl ester cyclase
MLRKRKIKRVFLINPPSYVYKNVDTKRTDYPFGLGYIASMLKMEGFVVGGVDALLEGFETEELIENGKYRYGLTDEQIKKVVDDFQPDAVGVSNMFTNNITLAVHTCRLVKEVNPDIVTFIGGFHPTTFPESCLRADGVDFVILGEGEYTTGILLRAISRGTNLHLIPGIGFLDEGGHAVINSFIEPIQNIDILPWPDRDLFPVIPYSDIGSPHGNDTKFSPYTTFLTSRGCPYKCTFCASHKIHGRHFRPRSPENVMKELEYLVKEEGIREIHFEDDNLTFDRDRAHRIFQEIIDRKLNIAWTPTNCLAYNTVDRFMLEKMKESGCYALWFPVESGDRDVLKMMQKPTPMDKFRELVPVAKKLGIKTNGLFMFGLPGETREQMERTFKFAEELDMDYSSFAIFTPLPGTDLWDKAVEINPELDDPDYDFSRLKFGVSNLTIDGMTPEELVKLRRKVWLKVNWGLDEDQDVNQTH